MIFWYKYQVNLPRGRVQRAVVLSSVCLMVGGCAQPPVHSVNPPLQSPPQVTQTPSGRPTPTIVVDAGHGGHDPGTSHFGLKEKYLTLDMAQRLQSYLQSEGVNVVMTRETDQFVPLSGRPAVANRLRADLFVSVHINANRNRHISGLEVYYPRESVVASGAQWPPEVRSLEVAIPSTTVRQVLWDLVLWKTRFSSRRLATAVCHAMRGELRVPCRGVKAARFVVLREAWMPSILVEVGYVTNRAEATHLKSSDYREAAAAAMGKGILSYLREREHSWI